MVADIVALDGDRKRAFIVRQPFVTEARVVFAVSVMVYLLAAAFLALHANVIIGDVLTRTENAQRVLFGRDPHLAAIGFVWSPLPVLAMLPLVPLKAFWPALTQFGLTAGIVSAVAMAFGTVQVRGVLADLGTTRGVRIGLTALFAVHPLVFYFGSNGMSEAMLVAFLVASVRQLARWLRTFEVSALTRTGLALACAYLSRYEALPAAAAVAVLVGAVSFLAHRWRSGGSLHAALCDSTIVVAPVLLAFVTWTATSWLVTGHLFEQVASVYGNTNMLRVRGEIGWSSARLLMVAKQVFWLEPVLPILLCIRWFTASTRRDPAPLAAVAILGSSFAFMVWAILSASIDEELRYLITVVPLTVIMAGALLARGPIRSVAPYSTAAGWPGPLLRRAVFPVLTLGSLLATAPAAAVAMGTDELNPRNAEMLQSIFWRTSDMQRLVARDWVTERLVAADLDSMNLPRGSVLMDDFGNFAIVLSSRNPEQFVITADRDFQSILADPASAGVKYVLVPEPSGVSVLDAINREYPGFYYTGSGIAHLVRTYRASGLVDANTRLYRLDGT